MMAPGAQELEGGEALKSAELEGGLVGCGEGMWETHGRKLQAEEGRWETRVKISEMRRCCTLVS